MKSELIIFSTGEKYNPKLAELGKPQSGGSGFLKLAEAERDGRLQTNISVVVSNYAGGGVEEKAEKLGIPFVHFPKDERTPESHEALVRQYGGERTFVALSGCLWLVPMKESSSDPNPGLDPQCVINIHPGPLPLFGGVGMHGDHVHKAVLEAGIPYSAVTMHFATKEFDEGPIIFEYPIPILKDDTVETLRARVNQKEHEFQWWVTNLVVTGQISWDGENPDSLIVPDDYEYLPKIG